MGFSDPFDQIEFKLERNSPFSYRCNGCSRCCHQKGIRVGPYEILRLARRLGMTTTEFIARHTEAGGTILRTQEEDDYACIFLTAQGCSVHRDRPLVCRVYPLARWVDTDGQERYGHMPPHPETAGIYGQKGTVADFLNQQEIAPFYEMSDRYGALYLRMVDLLERLDAEEAERNGSCRDTTDEGGSGVAGSPWLDIDATVAEFCAAQGAPIPADIEGLVDLHFAAIEAWLASL